MKVQAHMKYGEKDSPWKPNLLTALLQIVFFFPSLVVVAVIWVLVFLYEFLTVGSQHIVFSATPKKIQMPDGSAYEPK